MKKIKIILVLLLVLPISLVAAKLMTLGKKIEQEALTPLLLQSEKTHPKGIKIGFYGTSCFTVSYNGYTYLNDPFFSNPNYLQIVSGNYEDRSHLIRRPLEQIDSISMVTITHGHYDHCLDVPSFKYKINQTAKWIASSSTLLSLTPWIKGEKKWRQYHIERIAQAGWIYSKDKTFRVHPVRSTHQDHIGKIKFFTGTYEAPLASAPGPVWQWIEGHTYSYVVDVLQDGEPIYRILLMSGEMPDESINEVTQLSKEKSIDLFLPPFWHRLKSGPSFDKVYAAIKPGKVIFHHWNNFFRDPESSLQMIRTSDIKTIVEEKRKAGIPVSIMLPFTFTNI